MLELARLLTVYCGRMIVHIIPFTEIQEEIRRQCPEEYFTLIMRRFMMRLAEAVARKSHASALVTGESLGQVASQTIKALGVTEDVTKMPVLRPLIGTDKVEIIRMAREIGTYATSILPYEDCCTVFTPGTPPPGRCWRTWCRRNPFWILTAWWPRPWRARPGFG